MNISPAAHVVYGAIAAGKSTHARHLATEHGAVRFAVDEWMHELYGPDVSPAVDVGWVMTRVARCRSRIWSVAQAVLSSGVDVVLDIGLMRASEREQTRQRIVGAGFKAHFHFIDTERSQRLSRLQRRNAERGDTFTFEVTPAMFDMMDPMFEPPTHQELLTHTHHYAGTSS